MIFLVQTNTRVGVVGNLSSAGEINIDVLVESISCTPSAKLQQTQP